MIYYCFWLFVFVSQLLVITDSSPVDSLSTLDPSKMYYCIIACINGIQISWVSCLNYNLLKSYSSIGQTKYILMDKWRLIAIRI